jgi:hypothetical protein
MAHGLAEIWLNQAGSGKRGLAHEGAHTSACVGPIRALGAALGRDSWLQSTFEGESRLSAAAGEVS